MYCEWIKYCLKKCIAEFFKDKFSYQILFAEAYLTRVCILKGRKKYDDYQYLREKLLSSAA